MKNASWISRPIRVRASWAPKAERARLPGQLRLIRGGLYLSSILFSGARFLATKFYTIKMTSDGVICKSSTYIYTNIYINIYIYIYIYT